MKHFPFEEKADFLKEIYEHFHKTVTRDGMASEFLNWYDYIKDSPKQFSTLDMLVFRKESIFSPFDMEDPKILDCYGFLPDYVKKDILEGMDDIEREDIIPKLKEFLKGEGVDVPASIATLDDLYDYLQDKIRPNMSGEQFEEIYDGYLDGLEEAKGSASLQMNYPVRFDLECFGDEARLRISFDGRQDLYESDFFDPADSEARADVLQDYKNWLAETYDSEPWVKNDNAPQMG